MREGSGFRIGWASEVLLRDVCPDSLKFESLHHIASGAGENMKILPFHATALGRQAIQSFFRSQQRIAKCTLDASLYPY